METSSLELNLDRQLEWIRTADTKVPPLFAINTAMLGVLMALMKGIDIWNIFQGIASAVALLLLGACIICLCLAMFPRTSGHNGSNIYFGGISSQSEEKYIKAVIELDADSYWKDLLSQTYRNAEIVTQKYSSIKLAFILLFFALPAWLLAVYALYI
jgi:hypothetical protein